MRKFLRKLRGILGTGVLWGAAGIAAGSLISVGMSVAIGLPLPLAWSIWGLGMGGVGFILGCGFAGVLTLFDGRITLDELTPARAARWGALAGAAVPAGWLLLSLGASGPAVPLSTVLPVFVAAAGTYALTGGVLAAGTVWLARRAPDRVGPGDRADEPFGLLKPDRSRGA